MVKYRVRWTSTAVSDLREIIDYISMESEVVAKQKYLDIKLKSMDLEHFPEKGRIIPELKKQNIEKYRELIIKPWRLFYRVEQHSVYILAVIDGRRNIEDILLSRNLR